VAHLNQIIATATTQITSLTEAYGHVHSQDLLDLRTRVETLKKTAKNILENNKTRAAKIDNSQIEKPEDIEGLLAELRALFSVFDGCQVDLANFTIYQKWLQRFDDDAGRLDDRNLTPATFAKLAKSLAREAKSAQTDDDELPWDIEETYETLMTTIQARRETAAEKWLAENVPTKKSISTLEARDAQRLKTFLQSSPAFLSKEQIKKVEDALSACEVRLDDLQVDGLLAKFEALSDAAKREFMKKAENMMK
jgi:thioester reductase-like protein